MGWGGDVFGLMGWWVSSVVKRRRGRMAGQSQPTKPIVVVAIVACYRLGLDLVNLVASFELTVLDAAEVHRRIPRVRNIVDN